MVEVFPTLLDATKVTLFLSVLALVLAFALALVLAFIRYFKIAILSPPWYSYTSPFSAVLP